MTPGPLPPPSRHGGDAASIAHALGLDPASMVDLSASMNPFAPAIGRLVSDAIARDRHALTAYPDPSEATYALAHAIGVDPDLLVLTNGGAEAIALVAAEMPVGNIVEPEFSLYRRHLAAVDAAAPRWRSNPSNPMGRLAAATDAAAVWDEATIRWRRETGPVAMPTRGGSGRSRNCGPARVYGSDTSSRQRPTRPASSGIAKFAGRSTAWHSPSYPT